MFVNNILEALSPLGTAATSGSSTTWSTLTDGTTTIRKLVRDGYYVVDKTLTATGFAGTEGVDWENVKATKIPFWQAGDVPFQSDVLMCLSGEILHSGGNYYFVDVSGNDRHFLITGYDFPTGWTKGFPYKSAATISAPAGDMDLIAADVNNFLYTAGVPNQIPVVSLNGVGDVDYANRLFYKKVAQVVDGNGVETSEAYTSVIVLYASAKTGADLTVCQTYYSTVTELTTGMKWSDFIDGLDTNTGTKLSKYKTINKDISGASAGNTAYVQTAENTEVNGGYNILLQKALTIQGTGFNVVKGTNTGNAVLRIDIAAVTDLIQNLIIDGTGGIDRGIQAEHANKTFNKCLIRNNDVYAAYLSGGSKIQNTIITEMGVLALAGIVYIDTCYLYTAQIYCVYTNHATADLRLSNSKLQTRTGNTTWVYFNNLTNATILGNTFNIDHAINPVYVPSVTLATISFTYNKFNVSANLVQEILHQATTGNAWVIDNNEFNITNTLMANAIIGMNDANSISVQSNKFISESLHHLGAIVIKSTGTTVTATTKTNYISFKNISGSYHICYGTEGSGAGDGKLDGGEISENNVVGAAAYDNSLIPTDIVHGIFCGYNKDISIRYNRVNGAGYGIIPKGAGDANTTGMITYNVIINCNQGVRIKGQKGWSILNNTIISNTAYSTLPISVTNNAGVSECDDCVVKNNLIIYLGTTLTTGLVNDDGANTDIDYNMYYCPNVTPKFTYQGNPKTWAEWQALGKDTHSVLLTTEQYNALFTDADAGDYSLPAGSAAIGTGADLGATYDDGLDASTDWGDEDTVPAVVTKQQGASWDVGAYIH